MSRIGKLPVAVPKGVAITVADGRISVKGPKGELARDVPPEIDLTVSESEIVIERRSESRSARAMHGLARSLVNNMVRGVSQGYSRTLEIIGVGYRVEQKSDYLVFSLGYSHPIFYEVPAGLDVKIVTPTKLTLSGPDRELIGSAAATVRSFRPPEPYKGKGIKYADEIVRRKEGKSAAR